MPEKLLPWWNPGDEISAARLNEMQRVSMRNDRSRSPGHVYTEGYSASGSLTNPPIKFFKLKEVMGEGLEGAGESSDNVTHDRRGNELAYNEVSRDFDEQTDPEYDNLTDPLDLIYSEDQVVPCTYHNGKWLPISGVQVRHAITCKDDDGTYPPESEEPNVYPIRYIKLEYTELGGRQAITKTHLAENEGQDGYVANLYEGVEPHYIPEETIIWFYRIDGQNFTMLCCEFDEKSSSSVSQSESSKSSSSLSSNSSSSISASSQSSQSSQSSESSRSSESSQSSSVSTSQSSASSSSVSPQSTSSVSTSAQSESSLDDRQITVVTALAFDDAECELTYKTRTITFPVDSGVTIGDEVDN